MSPYINSLVKLLDQSFCEEVTNLSTMMARLVPEDAATMVWSTANIHHVDTEYTQYLPLHTAVCINPNHISNALSFYLFAPTTSTV